MSDAYRSLTRIVPAVRTLRIAGSPRPVAELRIRDLADIQSWLDARSPLPSVPRDAGLRERFQAAKALVDACEQTPLLDAKEGRDALDTREGIAVVLYLAVSRHDKSYSPQNAAEDALAIDDDEYAELWRILLNADPLRPAFAVFNEGMESPGNADSIDWPKSIAEFCAEFHCLPAAVYGLTVSEFMALRAGGCSDPDFAVSITSDERREILRQRQVAIFDERFDDAVALHERLMETPNVRPEHAR